MTGAQWGGERGGQWGGPDGFTWGSRSGVVLRDPTWIVGPVRADALDGEHPTVIIGEEVEWSFVFHTNGLPNHITRYNTLLDKIEIAGHAAWGKRDDHTPWFREQHGTDRSLIVKISPSTTGEESDEYQARGVWGLITNADTETSMPSEFCRVDLTVFVLARADAYDSRAQVRRAHEAADIFAEE